MSAAQIPLVSPHRKGNNMKYTKQDNCTKLEVHMCERETPTHARTNTLSNSLKHTSDLSEERSTNTPDGSVESLFSLSESLTREGMPLKAFTGTAVIFLLLRSKRPA
jgi:hypothetical protein